MDRDGNTVLDINLLLDWYSENKRDLPWRSSNNPYFIWISEIMLQQTRVDTVIPYYNKFIKSFPTVYHLSEASIDDVLFHWKGLGYYSRAQNLKKGAHIVVQEFNGRLPENAKLLKKIPGIGEYTAGAILSIAYEKDHVAVDGNVERIISRLYALEEDISLTTTKRKIVIWVKTLTIEGRARETNQAWMDLGSLICTPKSPSCRSCPFMNSCKAYVLNKQTYFPIKGKKSKIKKFIRAIFIIQKRNKYLLMQRTQKGLYSGLWEFPGVEFKKDYSSEDKVLEYISSAYHISPNDIEFISEGKHVFSHMHWHMKFYHCIVQDEFAKKDNFSDWYTKEDLEHLAIPSAYKMAMKWIKSR
ncbi:MAG: A/G-specific adenine glycosylase [Eubacteriales bacterium]